MAFNITDTIVAIESAFQANGGFSGGTMIGEPAGPVSELSVAIWMVGMDVVETTLADTIELHVLMARTYLAELKTDADAKPQEAEIARLVSVLFADLLNDFNLQSTIRNVDAAGQYGTSMSTEFGHVEVGGKMYRVADMTIPCIVDGSATFKE